MILSEKELEKIEQLALGTYRYPPKDRFDIEKDTLYGGLSGFLLPCSEFEFCKGITLSKTYASVIAPAILAFSPPATPSAPHPGPWANLQGAAPDILAELKIDTIFTESLGFNRLNTVWFVTALLRLQLARSIQMVVLSDRPLASVSANVETSNLLPAETDFSYLASRSDIPVKLDDLHWVKKNLTKAAKLMREPVFRRSFTVFDSFLAIKHREARIVAAWAAIENIIRPGTKQITKRLCSALAALLRPPGTERDQLYNESVACYKARGGAVHNSTPPEREQLAVAYDLARNTIIEIIENETLPDIEELILKWKNKT